MNKAVVILAILALVAMSARAGAAPGTPAYQSSNPPRGAMEHQAVEEVSVTFNELLDPSTASLSVSACGEDVDDENVVTTGFTVEVGVNEHPAGTYVVSYSVSGADDTPQERQTPTEGSYQFAYHSEQCGDEQGTGNHESHGGEHDDHHKGDGHGKHESGSGDGHKGGHGGYSGQDHTTTSHDEHDGNSHEEETHSAGHNSGAHGGGDHNKNHQGHKGGNGKKGHHSGQHGEGEHHGDAENNAGRVGSPSRPNDLLNLLLVLLLPALVGVLGGRRLRRLHLRPSG